MARKTNSFDQRDYGLFHDVVDKDCNFSGIDSDENVGDLDNIFEKEEVSETVSWFPLPQ